MEYNSFYGGRRGASFVIVKNYKVISPDDNRIDDMIKIDLELDESSTITETQREEWLLDNCMIYCFKQGGGYKTVNYDEYVLIDTTNKNDKDNGKIYRRGYEYNNDMGGAVYIGQIVGPAGMAPHVEMTTIEEVNELASDENLSIVDINGEHLYRKTEGEYAPTENLVPGQYYDEDGTEKFNDSIKFAACSVRDANSHLTTAYIGFIIPYPVLQYTAESVSPYYHRSDAENQEMENWDETGDTTDFNNDKLVVRTDDLSHPFFSRWNISVPKGKQGDTLKNFRITTVAAEDSKEIKLQNYEGIEDDRNTTDVNKRQILVYDYYTYGRDAGGDPVALYLGDYNVIDNFRIDDDGTVTIDYSHDDQDVYPNLFKWIKSISLNEDTGLFEIIFNYDEEADGTPTKISQYLTWLKDMDVQEDGTIAWTYTTPEDDRTYPQYLKWIKQVQLNAEIGLFEIDFNYETEPEGKTDMDGTDISGQPTHYEISLQWVKDVLIDEYGTITFDYTDKEDTIYKNYMKWIKTVSLNTDTGLFEVEFNYDKTRDGEDLAKEDTKYSTYLRYVKNIRIDEDGTIHFDYTYGEEQIFNKILKTVKSITIDSETGHVIITYNQETDADGNPTQYETDLRWVDGVKLAEDGTVTITYTQGEDIILNNKIKWVAQSILSTDGTLTFTYNDGTSDIYNNQLQWITDITLSDTGVFTIKYNNGTEDFVKSLRWPTSITVNTGEEEGEGDQKINISYIDGTQEQIGNPINYIMKTAISSDYHLLVLYSDPAKRQSIKDQGLNATYENRDDWYDLGYIGQGTVGAVIGKESDSAAAALAETLPPYSAWFIVEEDE